MQWGNEKYFVIDVQSALSTANPHSANMLEQKDARRHEFALTRYTKMQEINGC